MDAKDLKSDQIQVLSPFIHRLDLKKLPLLFQLLSEVRDLFEKARIVKEELKTSKNYSQIQNRHKDFLRTIESTFEENETLNEKIDHLLLYRYLVKEISGSLKFNLLKKTDSELNIFLELRELCLLYPAIIKPKALFYADEGEIMSDGIYLKRSKLFLESSRLASFFRTENTNLLSPTILYVVTIGRELDRQVKKLNKDGDFLKAYLLNGLGAGAAETFAQELNDYLNLHYCHNRNYTLKRFSPGYSDWPLKEQAKLFRILRPEDNIGVKLTEGFMMIPEKSTSGLMAPRKNNSNTSRINIESS